MNRTFLLCSVLLFAVSGCERVDVASLLKARRAHDLEVPVEATVLEATRRSRKLSIRLGEGADRDVKFFLREPAARGRGRPAVLILAGFQTGRKSLDLLEEREDMVLMSMDYPYERPPSRADLVRPGAFSALRRMGFRTLEAASMALSYLARRPDVDPKKLIVLGVSFGTLVATPLAAHDPRVASLVLVYGGGDLPALVRHHGGELPWWMPTWLPGALVRAWFTEFEPLEHVAELAPRPLIMVSTKADRYFPPPTAEALHARAAAPKTLIWEDTKHFDLFDAAVLRRMTARVLVELKKARVL